MKEHSVAMVEVCLNSLVQVLRDWESLTFMKKVSRDKNSGLTFLRLCQRSLLGIYQHSPFTTVCVGSNWMLVRQDKTLQNIFLEKGQAVLICGLESIELS